MAVGVQQQLIWVERELRGERALRRGWEAECRRMAVSNRELRLTVRILRAEVAALTPKRLEEVA